MPTTRAFLPRHGPSSQPPQGLRRHAHDFLSYPLHFFGAHPRAYLLQVHRLPARCRSFQGGRHPRAPGNPRREKLRILVHESGQVFLQRRFAGLVPGYQPPVLGPHDPVLHRSERKIDLAYSQTLQFGAHRRAPLRFRRYFAAALVLFHQFVQPALQLLPALPLLLQLRLVRRLRLRLFVVHELLYRLPYNRLYVDAFHIPPNLLRPWWGKLQLANPSEARTSGCLLCGNPTVERPFRRGALWAAPIPGGILPALSTLLTSLSPRCLLCAYLCVLCVEWTAYPASISSATRFLISCRASHKYLNASFLNTCFFNVSDAIPKSSSFLASSSSLLKSPMSNSSI